jgi:hypothetical protein
MAQDTSRSQEMDLERTDRLPILEGTLVDDDVADDAVRMDFTPPPPTISRPEFPRTPALDLPSLAESVRSVEERIARQQADYEALTHAYDKARESEAAAEARAQRLTEDLAGLRAQLESEQLRAREGDKALAEKTDAVEAARVRLEETLREAERHQSEARTLQGTLAARDATLAQVQRSLGERDAQLHALQREHAAVVPALQERSGKASQLEAELVAERGRTGSIAAELDKARQSVAALTVRLQAGDVELANARRDLGALQAQAAAYLEQLRTREWRRGFDENLFRELDAKVGAARDDRGVIQSERDRLRQRVADAEAQLVLRDEAIAKLNTAALEAAALRTKDQQERRRIEDTREELTRLIAELHGDRLALQEQLAARDESIAALQAAAAAGEAALAAEQAAVAGLQAAHSEEELAQQNQHRAALELAGRIEALESERSRMTAELTSRDVAVAEALAAVNREAEHGRELLRAAGEAQVELSEQILQLKAQAEEREAEMAVLVAHLQQARRPIEAIEAVVKRLSDEANVKTKAIEQLNEENRNLRVALERNRGALEEREFLIRRLERSESNNANVLGRIQTSIERLGGGPVIGNVGGGGSGGSGSGGGGGAAVECTAELLRLDGKHKSTHTLARRTRIGRAPGCEMQIESSSVSRHHALLLLGSREVIIEDLNSTNGVLVNGRKVSRQLLHDGDLVTIGEAQFRLSLKFTPRILGEPAAPAAGMPAVPAALAATPSGTPAGTPIAAPVGTANGIPYGTANGSPHGTPPVMPLRDALRDPLRDTLRDALRDTPPQ